MAYEYGLLWGMEHYDTSDTVDTLQDAMDCCAELQRNWDGSEPGEWLFVRGRWVADTDDPNVFWYVREVD